MRDWTITITVASWDGKPVTNKFPVTADSATAALWSILDRFSMNLNDPVSIWATEVTL